MLHREDSLYRAERNDDLLKLKPYQDAEARVIAHLPGQGKYLGMLGALLVRTANGTEFRIGTRLHRRAAPPATAHRQLDHLQLSQPDRARHSTLRQLSARGLRISGQRTHLI